MTHSTGIRGRLTELGLELPEVIRPVGSYVPAVRTGNLVFSSGQLPMRDGKLEGTGTVGDGVSTDAAAGMARTCALNALAAVSSVVDLDHIVKVVKVVGFVASTPDFDGQPAVVNGASDLFVALFGDAGKHARSAVGVAALPLNVPVEVEIVVEVQD